jgi:hypothetical protein
MNSKRVVRAGVLAAILFVAEDARAQDVSSFSDLPRVLEAGQRVIVREGDGRVSRGKVVSVDEHRLEIQWRRWLFAHRERSFTGATVESIKVKDSDWNGMLVGAGAGLLAGWLVDLQCCRDFPIAPLGAVMGALSGATVGSLIDQSINEVAYRNAGRSRVTFAPLLGAHRVGFTASKAF